MKKVFLLLAALVLSLGCTGAFAGCVNHPEAEEYEHSYFSHDEQWNGRYHLSYYYHGVLCDECSAEVSGAYTFTQESHDIDNTGLCFFCGYEPSDKPTPEELQQEAFRLMADKPENILHGTASVVHSGNVRAGADVKHDVLGAVNAGEKYRIRDYAAAEGNFVWLQIDYGTDSAWISAGLVSITQEEIASEEVFSEADAPAAFDPYAGRICKIKVSSGRARSHPGTGSKVVDYVGYGETYTVLASEYAADGTLWFQIETGNGACWISSGLVNIR